MCLITNASVKMLQRKAKEDSQNVYIGLHTLTMAKRLSPQGNIFTNLLFKMDSHMLNFQS